MIPVLSNNSPPTMTSRDIAELVDSRHDKVKQSIDRLVDRCIIPKPPVGDGPKAANGVVEKVYLIGKRDSYIIVAQLSPEFTARLVDRWQELEAMQPAILDLNDPHALRAALLGYSERVIALEGKITIDAPKVKFAEAIRNLDETCTFEQMAKILGRGRNKFIAALKLSKVLQDSRIPYQKYIDKGYFRVVETSPYEDSKGNTNPTFATRVTGKGQVWLQKNIESIEAKAEEVKKGKK